MLLLTLVRHAKSSWDYAELSDFERPLNERGRRDAPAMAQRLTRLPPKPDLLVSSPATRALATARTFAEALGSKAEDIAVNARIYDAGADRLLRVLREVSDEARHVALFGHNPGLSEFAHLLADCPFDDLPTCAMARIEFTAKSWRDVGPGDGRLVHYTYPKEKD